MKVIPAIDILNGKVMRLLKGDFNDATEYSNNPQEIAAKFIMQGFDHIHLIDLSGATLKIGGGIRSIYSS